MLTRTPRTALRFVIDETNHVKGLHMKNIAKLERRTKRNKKKKNIFRRVGDFFKRLYAIYKCKELVYKTNYICYMHPNCLHCPLFKGDRCEGTEVCNSLYDRIEALR